MIYPSIIAVLGLQKKKKKKKKKKKVYKKRFTKVYKKRFSEHPRYIPTREGTLYSLSTPHWLG